MNLVERSAALGMLRSVVTGTVDGAGAMVRVTGETGIGKTSLLRALVAELPRDMAVLAGACDDLLTARPLGPLRDAADVRSLLRPSLRSSATGVVTHSRLGRAGLIAA